MKCKVIQTIANDFIFKIHRLQSSLRIMFICSIGGLFMHRPFGSRVYGISAQLDKFYKTMCPYTEDRICKICVDFGFITIHCLIFTNMFAYEWWGTDSKKKSLADQSKTVLNVGGIFEICHYLYVYIYKNTFLDGFILICLGRNLYGKMLSCMLKCGQRS